MTNSQPRMTTQTLALLSVFARQPDVPWYGLELSQEAGVPPGSIYAILRRLVASEVLHREWEDIDPTVEGRPRRRLYRLTPFGRQFADAEIKRQFEALQPAVTRSLNPNTQPA
jgi:PadR family transcriptional regulator PadR